MFKITSMVLGPNREHYGFRYENAFDDKGNKIFVFYGMGGFESALNYRFRGADRSNIIDSLNAETVLPARVDPIALGHLGRLNLTYHLQKQEAFHETLALCRRVFGANLQETITRYAQSYAEFPGRESQEQLFRLFGLHEFLESQGGAMSSHT